MPSFDAAISFAGDDRDVAGRIAMELKRYNLSVIFDEFFHADMVGRSLSEYLESVFASKASHCIMLFSDRNEYRPIPDRGHCGVLADALTDTGYLIPIRLDATNVPGLSGDTCHLDLQTMSFSKVVKEIARRMEHEIPAERFPVMEPLTLDVVPIASLEDHRLITTQVEELLETLRVRWATRLERLRNRHSNVSDDRLFVLLLSQEMHRVIEMILYGVDRVACRFLSAGSPRLTLDTLRQQVDSTVLALMDEMDLIAISETCDCRITGKQVTFGGTGTPIANDIMDSTDRRMWMAFYQMMPLLALARS